MASVWHLRQAARELRSSTMAGQFAGPREWRAVRRDRPGAAWTNRAALATSEMPSTQVQLNRKHGPERGARTMVTWWSSLQWWPSLVGIGLAAFIALGMSAGSAEASTLAASGLVYLGAAALQKPSAAWPLFLLTFLLITASKVATRAGLVSIDATWLLIGLAIAFVVYGLMRGATHPAGGLRRQAIAMVVCGLAAAHRADRQRKAWSLSCCGRAARPCGLGRLSPPGQQGRGALDGRVLLRPGYPARAGDRGRDGTELTARNQRTRIARTLRKEGLIAKAAPIRALPGAQHGARLGTAAGTAGSLPYNQTPPSAWRPRSAHDHETWGSFTCVTC